MASDVHVNDYGTIFKATIKDQDNAIVDVSTATTKQLRFKAPSTGSSLVKNAAFVTNGSDGQIQYISVSGDITVAGTWQLQGFVITPSGAWSSSIESFQVLKNLE